MTHADAAAGTPTVLVADDEQVMRELIAALLEIDGCRVLQAQTGAEAIALVEKCDVKIDLLIMDVMMPEMTGPEAAARIREQRPEIVVLFLTGQDPDAVRERGLADADADVELLGKPFETGEFRRRVRNLIDSSPTG